MLKNELLTRSTRTARVTFAFTSISHCVLMIVVDSEPQGKLKINVLL